MFAIGASSLAFADFDNDGTLDLVAVNGAGMTAYTFKGNGNGTFTAGPTYPVPDYSNAVWTTDVDHDGTQDVVFGCYPLKDQHVRYGIGDGTFGAMFDYMTSGETNDVATADFDHDGFPDLAVAMAGGHGISIRRGIVGGFDMTIAKDYAMGNSASNVVLGDFDNDGQ